MPDPTAYWPTSGQPNPNPTWMFAGFGNARDLTLGGRAAVRDPDGYFDAHSPSSVTGVLVVDIGLGGPVSEYVFNYSLGGGAQGADGVWEWQVFFAAVLNLTNWQGGAVTCKVRFTGTHGGAPASFDTPAVPLPSLLPPPGGDDN